MAFDIRRVRLSIPIVSLLGGMGEVYRAHDDRLGRGVAVKIVATTTEPSRPRLT